MILRKKKSRKCKRDRKVQYNWKIFFIYFLHKIFSVEKKGSEEIFCFMEVRGKCVGKIPGAINKGDFVGSFDKR